MTTKTTITDDLKALSSMITVAIDSLHGCSGFDLNELYGRNNAARAVLADVSERIGTMIEEEGGA